MRKLFTVVYGSLITFALVAAPTANEDFVIEEAANAYTNALRDAKGYTDSQIRALPAPDFSTSNATLVATIEATAPAPGDYAAVSNRAMTAIQPEALSVTNDFVKKSGDTMTGSLTVSGQNPEGFVVRRPQAGAGHLLGGEYETKYSLDKIVSSVSGYTKTLNIPFKNGTFATTDDITSANSNAVLKTELGALETDPTIKSWAKAATKPTYTLNEVAPNAENWLGVQGDAGRHIKVLAGTVGGQIVGGMRVTASTQNDNNMTTYTYGGVAVRRNGTNTDYLWDTTSSSGIVRRAELDDKADADDLSRLSASVTSISGMLNAENARFVSTNYNSAVHLPEAYVEAKIEGNWITIWSEMMRWNWLTGEYLPTNYYTKAQINSALDGKADRAWGFYDSHTGEYAPDGYAWVSAPKIAISGGLAYSRTVTSEGAVWVLESNGLVTETGGVVSNGFFRVSDDEGNSLFEIVKGDKRTVGAQAGSVRTVGAFTPAKLEIGYPVQAETHPVLQIAATLTNPTWYAEDDASCPANVSWSGTSGNYVVQVQAKSSSATELFVKAEYEVGGETYIKNTAPVSVTGGILCTDGVHKVRPVYNNGAITWEVVQ